MEIIRTFELPNTKLLAVKYEGNELDALEILQNQWGSTEFLREFFTKYKKDHYAKYGSSKLNRLVQQAKVLADDFFELLLELAEDIESNALLEFFKPLDNKELGSSPYELQKVKGRTIERKSYLRIYAIRYKDKIVVTGGAIKLTDKMEERPHTNDELKKLELVKVFLDVNDPDVTFSYIDVK